MANVALQVANPIYIDTAATLDTGWLTIQTIVWTDNDTAQDDIADTDNFTLTDTAGNVVCHKEASAAGDGFDCLAFPFGLKVNGLICTAVDGGVAFVYIKE